jgi:hypothetical protein
MTRLLLSSLALLAGVALAVPASAATDSLATSVDDPLVAPTRAVGDATGRLLALQRSGSVASPVPQPIQGDIASRSYARYLKSFEYAIPEKLGATGPQGGAAGSGSGGGDSSSVR